MLQLFVRVFAPIPVLLVPGNWEHWSGLDFLGLQSMLASSGGQLLLNERWAFSRGGRSLVVMGLDDDTAGQPDLQLLDTRAPSKDSFLCWPNTHRHHFTKPMWPNAWPING